MNERLKTHSKTQKKSADLVSNKLRIGVFQRYQMKCKSVSKKSPRYMYERGELVDVLWGELEWSHPTDDDELPEVTGPAWIVDNVAHYGG